MFLFCFVFLVFVLMIVCSGYDVVGVCVYDGGSVYDGVGACGFFFFISYIYKSSVLILSNAVI